MFTADRRWLGGPYATQRSGDRVRPRRPDGYAGRLTYHRGYVTTNDRPGLIGAATEPLRRGWPAVALRNITASFPHDACAWLSRVLEEAVLPVGKWARRTAGADRRPTDAPLEQVEERNNMVRKIALAGVGVVVALTLAVLQSPANATTVHAAVRPACVLNCPI